MEIDRTGRQSRRRLAAGSQLREVTRTDSTCGVLRDRVEAQQRTRPSVLASGDSLTPAGDVNDRTT